MAIIPIIGAVAAMNAARIAMTTATNTVLHGSSRRSTPKKEGGWAVVFQSSVGPITSAPVATREEAESIAAGSASSTNPRVIKL